MLKPKQRLARNLLFSTLLCSLIANINLAHAQAPCTASCQAQFEECNFKAMGAARVHPPVRPGVQEGCVMAKQLCLEKCVPPEPGSPSDSQRFNRKKQERRASMMTRLATVLANAYNQDIEINQRRASLESFLMEFGPECEHSHLVETVKNTLDPNQASPKTPASQWDRRTHTEGIGLSMGMGVSSHRSGIALLHLSFATLRWPNFYWTAIRGTVGANDSQDQRLAILGTTLGIPLRSSPLSLHEWRVGTGLSFGYYRDQERIKPSYDRAKRELKSVVVSPEFVYHYHGTTRVDFELGIRADLFAYGPKNYEPSNQQSSANPVQWHNGFVPWFQVGLLCGLTF